MDNSANLSAKLMLMGCPPDLSLLAAAACITHDVDTAMKWVAKKYKLLNAARLTQWKDVDSPNVVEEEEEEEEEEEDDQHDLMDFDDGVDDNQMDFDEVVDDERQMVESVDEPQRELEEDSPPLRSNLKRTSEGTPKPDGPKLKWGPDVSEPSNKFAVKKGVRKPLGPDREGIVMTHYKDTFKIVEHGLAKLTKREKVEQKRKDGKLRGRHLKHCNLMKKPDQVPAEPVVDLLSGPRPFTGSGPLAEPLMFVIKQPRPTTLVLADDDLTKEIRIVKREMREGPGYYVLYDRDTSRYLIVKFSDLAAVNTPRREKIFQLSLQDSGVQVKLCVKDSCVSNEDYKLYRSEKWKAMSQAQRENHKALASNHGASWLARNQSEFVLRIMDPKTVFTVVPQRCDVPSHPSGLQFDLLLYGEALPEVPYGVRYTATSLQLYMYLEECKVWVKKAFTDSTEAYGDRAIHQAMESFAKKYRDGCVAGMSVASEITSTLPHFLRSMWFVADNSNVGLNEWGFFQEPYGNHSLLQAVGLAIIGLPLRSSASANDFILSICDEMLSASDKPYYIHGEARCLQTIVIEHTKTTALLPKEVVALCFEEYIGKFRAGEMLLDKPMEELFMKVVARNTNATIWLVNDGVGRSFSPPKPDPRLVVYVVEVANCVWGALVQQNDLQLTM
jgi:hypothetical protein